MAVAATEAVLATEAGDTGDLDLPPLFFLGVFGVVRSGAMGGGLIGGGGGGMIEDANAVPLFQSCVAGAGVGNARSKGTPGR